MYQQEKITVRSLFMSRSEEEREREDSWEEENKRRRNDNEKWECRMEEEWYSHFAVVNEIDFMTYSTSHKLVTNPFSHSIRE